MIPRYTRQKMAEIWSQSNKYRIWFDIEFFATEAMAQLGLVPEAVVEVLRKKGRTITFDEARIAEIEAKVKHDVIAFLTHLSELIGEEARFVHQGMTSSDVLDTCLNIQLSQASDVLLEGIDRVLAALKKRAFEFQYTPCIGRSHGIHAEPTTFGLKLAFAYAEFERARDRLYAAKKEISTCAISGAVGTFAHNDPFVESYVAEKMGLSVEPISTQVIARDRHAFYFSVLAIIASSIERFATEIRHLQRTEVLEVEEYFAPEQKGSSAMPHKRNPVLSENITGIARLVRSAVIPALENVALWHERDISHSSVERAIAPDTTVHLDFALQRLADIIENLVVYPQNMQKNIDLLGGVIYSQRVLLALTHKGVSREEAYRIVQGHTMEVFHDALRQKTLLNLLLSDEVVLSFLSPQEIRDLFEIGFHLKHVSTLFSRVFHEPPSVSAGP